MTHPEITNPIYRKLFAHELLILRSVFGKNVNSEYVMGIRVGIETTLRRLENPALMESL